MAYFKCPKNSSKIYGAEWTIGSSPDWVRTDDAADFPDPNPYYVGMSGNPSSPFDDISPWKDIGYVVTSSAGVLTKIPKFYYKWTRTATKMKLQISMNQEEGFLVSPAHADRGDGKGERDLVYVGMFHCSSTDYKSTSGAKPKVSMSRANFRTNIHNLGSAYWQWDYAMVWTIRMLYLVEFASWNSQNKIGWGGSISGAVENCGQAMTMLDNLDPMYHTGTTATARTDVQGQVVYRYIEGLWDNAFDWVDGIYFSTSNIYCIKNPANFSDSSGGTLVGTCATTSGCISDWTDPSSVDGFEYALYPSAVNGTSYNDLYCCDRGYYYSSYTGLDVGGNYSMNAQYGLFFTHKRSATGTNSGLSSRIMWLP